MLNEKIEQLPLFVYGTLMMGERNHIDFLHQNLTHYEVATTMGELYYYRKEDYPALVKGHQQVNGQLFYVSQLEQVLKPLDEIEGYIEPNHPENMYHREIIEVKTLDGEIKKAYTYVINQRLIEKNPEEFTLMSPSCWKTFNQSVVERKIG